MHGRPYGLCNNLMRIDARATSYSLGWRASFQATFERRQNSRSTTTPKSGSIDLFCSIAANSAWTTNRQMWTKLLVLWRGTLNAILTIPILLDRAGQPCLTSLFVLRDLLMTGNREYWLRPSLRSLLYANLS